MIVYHTGLALHQSLSSALKAAFGGCALHAPAGAVARNDIVLHKLQRRTADTRYGAFFIA